MKKQLIIPIISGTLILFLWNAISWMVLPFHANSLRTLPDEALATNLEIVMPGSGVYHYPGLPNEETSIEEISKKLKDDPRITLMVYQEGSFELFEPSSFLKSLFINLLTCSMLFIILGKLSLPSLAGVLQWSFLLGLLVSFVSDVSIMNWFKFPLTYTMINVSDHIISFLLVGTVYWLFIGKKQSHA
ncbi:MAG: hypothetical protein RIF33_05060 [Cyclobacteriaceae bacterium]